MRTVQTKVGNLQTTWCYSPEPTFRFSFLLLFLLKSSILLVRGSCEKVPRMPSSVIFRTFWSLVVSKIAPLVRSWWKTCDSQSFDADSEYHPLKSDWLTNKNKHSGHMLKNWGLATGSDCWCWPKGSRPRGTRMVFSAARISTASRLEPIQLNKGYINCAL